MYIYNQPLVVYIGGDMRFETVSSIHSLFSFAIVMQDLNYMFLILALCLVFLTLRKGVRTAAKKLAWGQASRCIVIGIAARLWLR